ncbi:MAG: dTDP-4-dehydrorhamnose reductase [Deltaproteobacteria bacterium]|nr:dTDP-4-dehydrorhamnose reductase [Deltaproteobacteria bacterium]
MNDKILIFGSGLLGKALGSYLPQNFERRIISHRECDIMNVEGLRKIVAEYSPTIIVNAAAITDVDYCETHQQEAFIVNAAGAGYVASIARDYGARLIHFSTDYVFDGSKEGLYSEDEEVNPLNTYAKSKYEGEQLVKFSGANYLIARVQWLFGEFRETFIDKSIIKLKQGEEVDAVIDQFGSPTYVKYVVYAVGRLLNTDYIGVVHISSDGVCSRYEQLMFICDLLKLQAGLVRKKKWGNFKCAAIRPHHIQLNTERLYKLTGFRLPHWKDEVKEYIMYRYGREI